MAGLQISQSQASALSAELVGRHARQLGRGVDHRLGQTPAPSGNTTSPAAGDDPSSGPHTLAPAVDRLKALHSLLRAELEGKAGPAAPFLAIDLDLCAQQLMKALQAGWTYREAAAAGQMSAAAALGLRWLGDERLCMPADPLAFNDPDAGPPPPAPLPEPTEPHEQVAWAHASWSARFAAAAERAEALWVPVRYALDHALAQARVGAITSEALRSLADAVFSAEQAEHLSRFMAEERTLLAAAGLDAARLGDRRVESLCIAGDLAFGLGRCVRLARAATPASAGVPPDRLVQHLREALHALAETTGV
jgi:hypothetical protein